MIYSVPSYSGNPGDFYYDLCFGACSGGWTMLVQQSLKSLITTGKGKEVFG